MNSLQLGKDDRVKPCPFCHSTFVAHGLFAGPIMRVECIDCGAAGPSVNVGDAIGDLGDLRPFIDKAYAAWNHHEETPSEFERLCEVTK